MHNNGWNLSSCITTYYPPPSVTSMSQAFFQLLLEVVCSTHNRHACMIRCVAFCSFCLPLGGRQKLPGASVSLCYVIRLKTSNLHSNNYLAPAVLSSNIVEDISAHGHTRITMAQAHHKWATTTVHTDRVVWNLERKLPVWNLKNAWFGLSLLAAFLEWSSVIITWELNTFTVR